MTSSDEGTPLGIEYQVFLSFRGPDTREGFTDVLFHSLTDAGICVFRDNEELRVGERIDSSIQQAIDNSRIYIPVFSQNYASSQWCLRELTQILVNTAKSEDIKAILPIFFYVEPEDVKLKTALYSDAILSLQRKMEVSNDQVDAWRKVLKEVGAIKGWEVKKYNGQGKLIKLVVEEVVKRLRTKHRLVTEHLVGIDDRVVAISNLLDIDSGDVRLIQIHGMGGIGKTTLARVVFNKFISYFGKCCCFLEDIRANSSRTDGLVELQKKLLSEIGHPTGTRSIDEIDYGMKRIGEVLRNNKVLIVLDDVDNNKQVEKLVGKSTLYPGSRILITTRNKDVMQIHRPMYQILNYEMEVMSTNCALELFSKHAFNRESPLDDYNDLSMEIVSATGGLPLALEVIGSLLYHKRMQEQWEKTLKGLRKAPHADVFGKLKISYDALSFEQQQIFLDVAFFFIGKDKMNAIYMWEDCGLLQNDEVDVLNSMCLIKIVGNNKFWMHDQLRDLAREIVRQENQMNPAKRSRLRVLEEFLDIITTKEMKNVQALNLNLSGSHHNLIRSEEIRRFENLRYIKLDGGNFVGNLVNCLTKLRWIFWSHNPQTSEPIIMDLKNVVVLQFLASDFLDDSKLQSLIKTAGKLKALSLKLCRGITRTPDFSRCPKLKRLSFQHCRNLNKIDNSIEKLKHLTDLRISHCRYLEDLPEEIGGLVNLKYFFLKSCEVKKLPDSIWKLKSLSEVHFSSDFSLNDIILDPANSWELPSAIGMLQDLEVLLINNKYLQGQLPSEIGNLPSLRILDLSYSCVNEVPMTINMLSRLQRLELLMCNKIQELPTLPTSLIHLLFSSSSLRVFPNLSNLTNLVELDLSNDFVWREGKICTSDLQWIGRLSKLNELTLKLVDILAPIELASLSQLKKLCLCSLDLRMLAQLPSSLLELTLDGFNSTVTLSSKLENLSRLNLSYSKVQEIQLNGLQLQNLAGLVLADCYSLERLMLSNMRKLKSVQVEYCPNLVEFEFAGVFESLKAFSINCCESLGRFTYTGEVEYTTESIICEGRLILLSRVLNKLESFKLGYCPSILRIEVLGTSESWKIFEVSHCRFVRSLCGLSNLKKLMYLIIQYCDKLLVVEGLNELEFLSRLVMEACKSGKRWVNVASTELPNGCHVHIFNRTKDFWRFLGSYKHHNEQESDFEREQESDLEREREQEQESESDFEREQESDFEWEHEQEQESDFEQEQENESDFKREQESDLEREHEQEQESNFE